MNVLYTIRTVVLLLIIMIIILLLIDLGLSFMVEVIVQIIQRIKDYFIKETKDNTPDK